jgi:hypothetical protein
VQALQPVRALYCDELLVAALADAALVAELVQDGIPETRQVAEPVTTDSRGSCFCATAWRFGAISSSPPAAPRSRRRVRTIVYGAENIFIGEGVNPNRHSQTPKMAQFGGQELAGARRGHHQGARWRCARGSHTSMQDQMR